MDFTTKIAIVTGAATGVGFAFSSKLLEKGSKVLLTDKNIVTVEGAYQKLKDEHGARVKYAEFSCDVTIIENIKEAFNVCERELGKPNLLINNAGEVNEKCVKSSMLLLLEAPINGTEIAIEYMGKHNKGQGGNVVNVASVAGANGIFPYMPYYVAAKSGLVSYTKNIGHSLNFDHTLVNVQCICPGKVNTALMRRLENDSFGEHLSSFAANIFARAGLKPDELANYLVRLLEEGKPGAAFVIVKGKDPYYY